MNRIIIGCLLALALGVSPAFAAPAKPVILAPSGNISTGNPELVWQDQSDATQFRVYVYDRKTRKRVYLQNHDRDAVCDDGVCRLSPGLELGFSRNHRFLLKARNSDGYSNWTRSYFHYVETRPEIVTTIAPEGEVFTSTPEFQWQAESNATQYRLYVWNRDKRSRQHLGNYQSVDICDSERCSVVVANMNLTADTRYLFRVRARNSAGWNKWSPAKYFTISEPAASPLAIDDYANVNTGESVAIDVLGNDTGSFDATTVDVSGEPAAQHGTLSVDGTSGVVTYTPDVDTEAVVDAFTYTVRGTDGQLSNPAAVQVRIKPRVMTFSEISYVGGFTLPADDFGASNLNYAQGIIEVNGDSMFIVGHKHHDAIAEFQIPALVDSFDIDSLNSTGAPVQSFSDVLGRAASGNPEWLDQIVGLERVNGSLIVNAMEYYDAPGDNLTTTLVVTDADHIAQSSVSAIHKMDGAARSGGWISKIPSNWQHLLGAGYISGNASGDPIVSRLSVGPSAFAVDFPASLNTSESLTIGAEELQGFSLDQPLQSDLYNEEGNNALWTHLSHARYGFIVPGTRTYMTLGWSGGHHSGLGYQSVRPDGSLCLGVCANDEADVYNYYWLWDIDDWQKVRNGEIQPHQMVPYEFGEFQLPFQTDTVLNEIGGASFDEQTGLLYLSILDANVHGYDNPPIIVAFSLSGGGYQPPENQAPVAQDDSVTVAYQAVELLNVLGNDADTDGTLNASTVTVTSGPMKGTAIPQADGSIRYEHTANATGTDSFTYTVVDNDGAPSNVATVTVTITEQPNVAPVAEDDTLTVAYQAFGVVSVLANDGDSDGTLNVSTVTVISGPTKGTAVPQSDGTIRYEHTNNVAGTDSFTYTVADNDGEPSNTATVTVTIIGLPNVAPLAADDSVTVAYQAFALVNVLGNDDDSDGSLNVSTVTVTSAPTKGTAVPQADGTIRYEHTADTAGTDSFTYTVADNDGSPSNTATVTVTITEQPNVAPVAEDDSVTVAFTSFQFIDVLGNDDDLDGSLDVSTVTVTSVPAQGIAVPQADGSIRYEHTSDSAGADSFTYTVADDNGEPSNPATVVVTIEPNILPVAIADTFTVTFGIPEPLDVLDNDTDAEGQLDVSMVEVVEQPTNGSAEPQADGTILYTHNSGSATSDSFTYRVADNAGGFSNVVTVDITIDGSSSLVAIHRSGQTFLTWDETNPTDGYHVYRSSSPITEANLASATRLTNRWGPLGSDTSVNIYRGHPELPANFVIDDLGDPLRNDQGLFVYTTNDGDSETAYYAVTSTVNAVEDTSTIQVTGAVTESVDTPSDVLSLSVNGGLGRIYTQYMDYSNWNPTFNGYAYNYAVALPENYDITRSYPLLIQPHAYDEAPKFEPQAEFDWDIIQMFPYDPGFDEGSTHTWWYGYAADHNYLTEPGIPDSGRIANFTEQRVMRSVDTMIANSDFSIDEKLIHAYGASMGASGVLSWGMRYPSLLAGIYAGQPMTNYNSSPTFVNDLLQLWGSKAANLPIVNAGPYSEDISMYGEGGVVTIGVWDWMNHHKQLSDRRGDEFAYLMTSHGQADRTIDWLTQGKPTVQAFTDANVGFSAVFDGNGHTWQAFDAVVRNMFGFGFGTDFAWKYPVDLSFPAIQNASASGDIVPEDIYPPGTPADQIIPIQDEEDPSVVDNHNLDLEWATAFNDFDTPIVDEAKRYEITIKSTSVVQTADITPRRTQLFRLNATDQCNWTAIDRNSSASLGGGTVTADVDSLVTVQGVNIVTGVGTRLVITCP